MRHAAGPQLYAVDPLTIAALVVAATGAGFLIDHWQVGRARDRLGEWASREGYLILVARRRWLGRGPFWLASDYQVVFRVQLRPLPRAYGLPWIPPPDRDAADDALLAPVWGWARVGSYWRGLASRDVEVRLDA